MLSLFKWENLCPKKWDEVTINLRAKTKARSSVLLYSGFSFHLGGIRHWTKAAKAGKIGALFSFAASFDPIISAVDTWGPSSFVQWYFPRQSGRLTRARLNKMKAREAVTNPSIGQLSEAYAPLRESCGWCQAEHHLTGSRERET